MVAWNRLLLAHRADPSRNAAPTPLFVVVHGPPGTGKTRVADELTHVVRCVACAPTGIAASLFKLNATTCHSLLGLPVKEGIPMKSLSVDRLSQVGGVLDGVDILLLDEISFLNPPNLSRIERRLREVKSDARPFGGMTVVVRARTPVH